MKKSRSEEAILRAHVRRVIKEEIGDDIGFGAAGSYEASGGLGGGPYYQQGSLAKIFIKPFTDVIGVATGKVKEMAAHAVTVVRVAFETVMTTLLPFLTDSYKEIFDEHEKNLSSIKSEYSAYYKASDEAFRNSGLTPLAFMAFPGAALTGKAIEDGPDAVRNILSVATGGLTDKYLGKGGGGKSPSSVFDSYARAYDRVLNEAGKDGKGDDKEKEKATLADKMGSKKFIEAILNKSPTMRSASKELQEAFKDVLKEAYEQAESVLHAKSLEDMQKAIGRPLKGMEELKKLKPEERKRGEEELLKTTRKSLKKFYTLRLEKDIEPVAQVFGDEFPLVKLYREVVKKIEAL